MSAYRWFAVTWWRSGGVDIGSGVKLGPVTLFWYRWFDNRLRVSVTVLGGQEHIVFGGHLT